MTTVFLRLLGIQRAEGDAPFARVVRDVAGVDLASADAQRAFLQQVMRARGHAGITGEDEKKGDDNRRFVVAGAVDRDGRLEGIEVTVVTDDLKQGHQPLAKARTNAEGEFSLSFEADTPPIIRIILGDERKRLYVSPPRRAERENWLEWSPGGRPVPRPAAFELREAVLHSALEKAGLKLEELEESIERLQISLLAETTGISRGHVAVHAIAARLEKKVGVPRAPLFALLGRSLSNVPWTPPPAETAVVKADGGLPGEFFAELQREARNGTLADRVLDLAEQVVLASDGAALKAAVAEAVRGGQISARAEKGLDKIVGTLDAARSRAALRQRLGGGSTWGELLRAAGVPARKLDDAGAVLVRQPPGEALLRSLADVGEPENRSAVVAALRMAPLVGHDARALESLVSQKVKSGADLASRPSDELQKIAAKAFGDAVDAAKRTQVLVDDLDRQFPGESLVRRMGGTIGAATREFLDRPGKDPVDVVKLNVDGLFKNGGLGADPKKAKAARKELLMLQRMARVTRNGRLAAELLEKKFDSAAKIAFTDRTQFLTAAKGLADVSELMRVHRRARAHYRATLALFLKYNRQLNGPSLSVMSGGGGSDLINAAEIQNAPTWEFLLGSPDYCDCEHCASVTSPAAYLVDLLLWLQRAPGNAPKPYDVLLQRRPDLVKILLNCKNTETLVPYIDLVCELLEEAVAIRADVAANPGAPTLTAAILDQNRKLRQTTLTAEEIRAYPEHLDAAVYSAVLSQFTDAMVPPFDLASEELRAYLATKGLTRLELMQLFGTGTAFERAAERLAIVPAERALITQASATAAAQATQWGFVGLAVQPADRVSVPLEVFLRRAPSPQRADEHISYDELLALLDCAFANPQRDDLANRVAIELEPGVQVDLCRATDRSVVRLTLDTLDRQHRFLRFARHVPWTLAEIDLLITAVGQGQLDQAAVTAMADCAEAVKRTGLSVEELAFLFLGFDASHAAPTAKFDDRPTLYARTFLSRTDGGGPPAVFSDPVANVATLAAEGERISGALGLSEGDLGRIMQATGLAGGNVSFAALSTLYRHARLAQALGIDAAVLQILRSQVADPFVSVANLLRVCEATKLVKSAGFERDDLAVLAGATVVTVPTSAPLTTALTALFASTEAQLQVATGVAPARAAVIQAIVDQKSWTAAVSSWLEIDSRFGSTLVALDVAIGAGQVVAGLYAAPQTQATLEAIARLAVLVRALDLQADDAADAAVLPGVLGVLRMPSWANLENAVRFLALFKGASSPDDLLGFVAAVPDNAVPRAELAQRLSTALGIDAPMVAGFWDAVFGAGMVDRNQLLSGVHYASLQRSNELGTSLGASADALKTWASAWPNDASATGVRNAIRSRLTRDEWLATSTKVQDELREKRRDALVRYLLATAAAADPKTSAELYGHFLIDVEMDDCMDTSRIVQANAAIQLFVQRCFLGLENVSRDQLATDHWKQWDWRQRYRLWEANRLVFLYPENFLNVARRSNATPLFRDFMKEVRQGDKDDENVRDGLDGYLAGLESLANLDYAALATNLQGDEGYAPELHVVGRSRGTPQKHYHRKLAGNVWTPWQELDVGTPGRHLALVHRRGTTRLLWPTFADHPDPRQGVPAAKEGPSTEAPPPRGVTYLSYAWVTKDRKKWSAVQTSARALLHQKRARRPILTALSTTPGGTRLNVYAPTAPSSSSADQDLALDLPYLGSLEAERDIVSIVVNHSRRALSSWLGGDHQPHIDATATLAPVLFPVGNDCNCLFWSDSSFTPWPGLAFDDNRMVARLTTSSLRIGFETATPGVRNTVTVLNSPAFSVAPDVCTAREVSAQPLQSGFSGYTSYFILNSVLDFGRDAFAVTDDRRSFLGLSRGALLKLAQEMVVPDGAELVLFPAYHPFASELRNVVRRYDDGFERLYTSQTQETPGTLGRTPLTFTTQYGNHAPLVAFSSATESIDFEPASPYALYNWEVFFQAPLFVAEQLRTASRFEEARRFYQFIFTPFTSEPIDPLRPRARYWVLKPFREDQGADDIRDIIANGAASGTNPYTDIENHPFDAQMVAQARPSAYQKHVVMRYLDNLIGWGDSLYRRGQREDAYEAIQLYILARDILGPQPEKLKPLGQRRDLAFEDEQWGGGGNALVELESVIEDAGEEPEESGDVPLVELPLVQGLYFCVPPNQTLLKYWTEVERRLYNLRHCLTIDGQPVRYDLLAAPIDPQALVDAAAAGVSVAEALAMAGSMLPPHRFRVIWGRAWDACNEVKALGAALLAALEKRDAERLVVIRSTWEGKILEKTRRTREKQIEQTKAEVEALLQSKKTVEARREFYRSREFMNDLEKAAAVLGVAAAGLDVAGMVFEQLSGVLHLIPNFSIGIAGFGATPTVTASWGGSNLAASVGTGSHGFSSLAHLLDRAGGLVSTQASYSRRKDDWDFQRDQATLELANLDKQVAAARLRVAVSEAELRGHEAQEKSWEETDAVLREKFSNEERYEWMIETLANLYRQAFEHALKLAKLARECLAFELPARVTVPTIGQAHWDSLQHGLLSGERLADDLRELDVVQATERSHERDVTQHIALSHVAPQALLDLRRTGGCSFKIPRWWLQRFDPKLTNRRVKALSVSVPSVTGPYVGMNATLSFQGSHRVLASISLSSGVNDFGVDPGVAGESYMPFEGISLEAETSWTFGFPQDPANAANRVTDVDFSTISDVVLHFQYTADTSAAATLEGPPAFVAFIDLRQMAGDAWAQLVSGTGHQCAVTLADLVPRFLTGYRATAVLPATVAVLDDGTVVTGKLAITLGAGAAAGTFAIALKGGEVLDWARLAKVFLVLKMEL